MATNPWNVPDASFFLKYSCPECDFQITHLNIFEVHATTQHELSSILFENIKNNDHKSFQEPFQDHTHEAEPLNKFLNVKLEEANTEFKIKQEKQEFDYDNNYVDDNNFEPIASDYLEHQLEEGPISKLPGDVSCHHCDYKTDSQCSLNKHLFHRHKEYPYSCSHCDFKTHQVTKLDEHMQAEHGISKYTGSLPCHLCEYRTDDQSNLNKHILRKHGEYTHPCHICDFKTNQPTKLDEHLAKEHGISKYKGDLACHKCEYRSDDQSNLNKHLLRKHNEYAHPCHICDFKTIQPTKIAKHLSQEHGISKYSGDFPCHICDFKTDQRAIIMKHTTKVHGEFSEFSYACHTCDFKANLISELKQHMLNEHGIEDFTIDPLTQGAEKNHTCHLCDFTASLNQNVIRHLRQAHGVITSKPRGKEGSKCCHICDYRTKKNSGLRAHIIAIHGEAELEKIPELSQPKVKEGSHVCHLCEFRTKRTQNLRRHLAVMHGIQPKTKEKEGSYCCHLCDYRSKYARDLQKHLIRIHEKRNKVKRANPYWCHVCDFSTKFNTNLRNHVAKNHGKSELKNIADPKQNLDVITLPKEEETVENSSTIDPENGMNLSQKTKREPSEVKNKVKSYICDVCNESYDSQTSLKEHKRIDHSISVNKTQDGLCPHCGEVIMILIFYRIFIEIGRNICVQINVLFSNA